MLNPDFKEMLLLLNENQVEYMFVGAYALASMGHPRATGHLDIYINTSAANATRVFKVLKNFGAPLHDLTVTDLQTPGIVFQIGLPPVRIDILSELTALNFEEAWKHHQKITISNVEVPVLGKEAFIKNKKALGRHKDLADVELLEGHDLKK